MLESEKELAAAAAAAATGALRAMELGGGSDSSSGTPSSSTGDLKNSSVARSASADQSQSAAAEGARVKSGTGAGHYKTLRRTRKYVVNGETRMTTSERIIMQGEEDRFHEEFDARYDHYICFGARTLTVRIQWCPLSRTSPLTFLLKMVSLNVKECKI